MARLTPGFFGILMRRNERTVAYCKLEEERLIAQALRYRPDEPRERVEASLREYLAEEPYLMASSVAMNGADLDCVIGILEHSGMRRGEDFVVTASPAGVSEPLPSWLREVPQAELALEQRGLGTAYAYTGEPLGSGGRGFSPDPGPRPENPAEALSAWLQRTARGATLVVHRCEPFAVDFEPAATGVFMAGWAVFIELVPHAAEGRLASSPWPMVVLLHRGKIVVSAFDGEYLPQWARLL